MVGGINPIENAHRSAAEPITLRLGETMRCSPELVRRIEALASRTEAAPARKVLQTQGERVLHPRFIVSGWACHYRHLADGRRQIFGVVLPGDGLGLNVGPSRLAITNTIALTPVTLVDGGPLLREDAFQACPELASALQAQAAADGQRKLDQIVRLGRLTALERMGHLFLELYERLDVIGQVIGETFPLPLTQETIADLTGLSAVHVNRTLQQLRTRRLVGLEGGRARLLDRIALAELTEYEFLRPSVS